MQFTPSPALSQRIVQVLSSPGLMRSAVVLDCAMFWALMLSKAATWSLFFAAGVLALQGLGAAIFYAARHHLALQPIPTKKV